MANFPRNYCHVYSVFDYNFHLAQRPANFIMYSTLTYQTKLILSFFFFDFVTSNPKTYKHFCNELTFALIVHCQSTTFAPVINQ